MPVVPSRDDGVQLVEGLVGGAGGGAGGSGGSGGGAIYRRSIITGDRPAFMEPLLPGVPSPNGGILFRERRTIRSVGAGGGGALRMLRNRRSSSFPIKDDAGYIGYLSDYDDKFGSSGSSGSSESGGDASDVMMKVLNRRRRELMGSDISFSDCMFMMVAVGGLLLLFLFAASPWGVPPPRRL